MIEQPFEELGELEDEDLAGLLDDPDDQEYQLDNILSEDDDAAGILTMGESHKQIIQESDEDDMGALADVLGELQEDDEVNSKKTKIEFTGQNENNQHISDNYSNLDRELQDYGAEI